MSISIYKSTFSQIPDKDLENRLVNQRVDPVTNKLYTKDIYDPVKPPKTEEEEEEQDEEDNDENDQDDDDDDQLSDDDEDDEDDKVSVFK